MTEDKHNEEKQAKQAPQDGVRLVVEEPKEDPKSEPADEQEADNTPSLTQIIREQAIEDEAPLSKTFTLKKVLGGDILNTNIIRQQIWVLLLITVFIIIYISNRYSCQQSIIQIDQLQKELQDAKYKALSSSSQLTEQSRESHVLDQLQKNNDSTIHVANQPPFIISIPSK